MIGTEKNKKKDHKRRETLHNTGKLNTNSVDNLYVADLHIVFFLTCFVVLVLEELGIYAETLLLQLRIGTVIMFMICVFVQILGRIPRIASSRYTKYAIMTLTLIETLLFVSVLNFHALLILCFPFLVVMNYHSTKLTIYTLVGSAVCALLFPVIGLKFSLWAVDYFYFLLWCVTGRYAGRFPDYISSFSPSTASTIFIGTLYGFQILAISYGFYASVKRKQAQHYQQIDAITKSHDSILEGMASVVENRDNNTGGHIKRTSDVVRFMTEDMPLDDTFRENIIKAAPLHDLGKIAIPDNVLNKPARLTKEEFEQIKIHPEKGHSIVKTIFSGQDDEDLLQVAENIALYHHEHYDGSGYPEGLSGDNIPLEARIMAIADVYDALVSHRCYKEPMSQEDAYQEIKNSMGTHFDPALWEWFDKAYPKISTYYANE